MQLLVALVIFLSSVESFIVSWIEMCSCMLSLFLVQYLQKLFILANIIYVDIISSFTVTVNFM